MVFADRDLGYIIKMNSVHSHVFHIPLVMFKVLKILADLYYMRHSTFTPTYNRRTATHTNSIFKFRNTGAIQDLQKTDKLLLCSMQANIWSGELIY